MPGYDTDLQVQVAYEGKFLYAGPAYWDWDDDDETQVRVTISVPNPFYQEGK